MSQEMFASCRKSKKGSAIVFALLALAVMLVVAVGSFSVSMVDQKSAIDTEKSVSAFQAADSGIEIVMQMINKKIKEAGGGTKLSDAGLCTDLNPEYTDNFSLTGREISVEFINSTGAKITTCSTSTLDDIASIKSTGEYGGTRRAVQVGLEGESCPTGEIADIYDPTIKYRTVVAEDGRCWLDRNLGAEQVAVAIDDSLSYGWYFQWGRRPDGHQIPSTSGTTPTQANISDPYPSGGGPFILQNDYWLLPEDESLWLSKDSFNNPCPIDFRLPDFSEINELKLAEGITDSSTSFNSTLKFPMAGYRHPSFGAMDFEGAFGYIWTSFKGGSFSLWQGLTGTTGQSLGYSVRCIKD